MRAEMIPHELIYNALVARAASGEDVGHQEWAEVEAEISKLLRKTTRCYQVLKYQQEEIAKINAELAATTAEAIVGTFAFLSPAWGHA